MRGARVEVDGAVRARRGDGEVRAMGVLSDRWIRRMARKHGMITPFEPGQVRGFGGAGGPRISNGTSSYGSDVRGGDRFKIFTNVGAREVDPKAFDEKNVIDVEGDHGYIPPNSFALATTVERLKIPRNVLTLCVGKSTLRAVRDHRERDAARCRVGGRGDAGALEHHPAAREGLRERELRADDSSSLRSESGP